MSLQTSFWFILYTILNLEWITSSSKVNELTFLIELEFGIIYVASQKLSIIIQNNYDLLKHYPVYVHSHSINFDKNKAEIIKFLVKKVLEKISSTPIGLAAYTVGLDSRVEKLMRMLEKNRL